MDYQHKQLGNVSIDFTNLRDQYIPSYNSERGVIEFVRNSGGSGGGATDIWPSNLYDTSATYEITVDLFGYTFIVNADATSNVELILILPEITSVDQIGAWFRFVKNSKYATIKIQARTGVVIADSTSGGYIMNDSVSENDANITLQCTGLNKWIISSGLGTWETV